MGVVEEAAKEADGSICHCAPEDEERATGFGGRIGDASHDSAANQPKAPLSTSPLWPLAGPPASDSRSACPLLLVVT